MRIMSCSLVISSMLTRLWFCRSASFWMPFIAPVWMPEPTSAAIIVWYIASGCSAMNSRTVFSGFRRTHSLKFCVSVVPHSPNTSRVALFSSIFMTGERAATSSKNLPPDHFSNRYSAAAAGAA